MFPVWVNKVIYEELEYEIITVVDEIGVLSDWSLVETERVVISELHSVLDYFLLVEHQPFWDDHIVNHDFVVS